jgi:hypothetical protein
MAILSSGRIGMGTVTPSMGQLDIVANKAESNMLYLANANTSYGSLLTFPYGYIGEYGSGYGGTICGVNYASLFRVTAGNGNVAMLIDIPGEYPIIIATNGTEKMRIASDGTITIASLAGSGSRAVKADANGVLSAP